MTIHVMAASLTLMSLALCVMPASLALSISGAETSIDAASMLLIFTATELNCQGALASLKPLLKGDSNGHAHRHHHGFWHLWHHHHYW